MRIRNARLRDAEGMFKLITEGDVASVDEVTRKIEEDPLVIFVATDFSANILGCSLSAEQVYVAENCCEAGVADELRSRY